MMNDEQKSIVILLSYGLIVSLLLIGFGVYSVYRQTEVDKTAIEAGLVKGEIPGKIGVHWIKPPKD